MRKIHSRSGDAQRLGEDRVAKRRKDRIAKDEVHLMQVQQLLQPQLRATSSKSEIGLGISTSTSTSL